ncbi:MAG TPA: hypothetical protein PLI18_10670 [Pirellulaceae bacterium]|nr:hypothetical protein [Pirellulaceae bacterium]
MSASSPRGERPAADLSKRVPMIAKLGGSLFELRDLRERVERWQTDASAAEGLLLAGGGPRVDDVRLDQVRCGWTDAEAHWRAIDLMSLAAAEVASRLELPRIDARRLDRGVWPEGEGWQVVDATGLLRSVDPLPRDWSVTSDSIAAWLARRWRIGRLVLFKSRPAAAPFASPGDDTTLVDRHFATLLGDGLSVEVVDLRSEPTIASEARAEFPCSTPEPPSRRTADSGA